MGIHFITKKRSHREELPIVECALLIVLVPGMEQSSRLLVAELDDDCWEGQHSGDPDSLADFENRVAALPPETGDQPGGVDAVKLSRNAGADRLPMKKPKKDPVREDRIYEVIADANGTEEQVMGWY